MRPPAKLRLATHRPANPAAWTDRHLRHDGVGGAVDHRHRVGVDKRRVYISASRVDRDLADEVVDVNRRHDAVGGCVDDVKQAGLVADIDAASIRVDRDVRRQMDRNRNLRDHAQARGIDDRHVTARGDVGTRARRVQRDRHLLARCDRSCRNDRVSCRIDRDQTGRGGHVGALTVRRYRHITRGGNRPFAGRRPSSKQMRSPCWGKLNSGSRLRAGGVLRRRLLRWRRQFQRAPHSPSDQTE